MLKKNNLFIVISLSLGIIISYFYNRSININFIKLFLIISVIFYIIFYYLGDIRESYIDYNDSLYKGNYDKYNDNEVYNDTNNDLKKNSIKREYNQVDIPNSHNNIFNKYNSNKDLNNSNKDLNNSNKDMNNSNKDFNNNNTKNDNTKINDNTKKPSDIVDSILSLYKNYIKKLEEEEVYKKNHEIYKKHDEKHDEEHDEKHDEKYNQKYKHYEKHNEKHNDKNNNHINFSSKAIYDFILYLKKEYDEDIINKNSLKKNYNNHYYIDKKHHHNHHYINNNNIKDNKDNKDNMNLDNNYENNDLDEDKKTSSKDETQNYEKPDINKLLMSNPTPLSINISYNSQNSVNELENEKFTPSKDNIEKNNFSKKHHSNRNFDHKNPIDSHFNNNIGNIGYDNTRVYNNSDWIYGDSAWTNNPDYYIPQKVNIIPQQPLNELASKIQFKEKRVCPLMDNSPWAEYKSGDSDPSDNL